MTLPLNNLPYFDLLINNWINFWKWNQSTWYGTFTHFYFIWRNTRHSQILCMNLYWQWWFENWTSKQRYTYTIQIHTFWTNTVHKISRVFIITLTHTGSNDCRMCTEEILDSAKGQQIFLFQFSPIKRTKIFLSF